MKRSTTVGLLAAVLAAATFGISGAIVKPLFDSGWSPTAAVTVRALIGGLLLAPVAVVLLRGRWAALWRGRWRVLGMGVVGVGSTQLLYFAAIERIPVGTGVLVQYMAPILLVGLAWVLTRRVPKAVVLVGSVAALAGLVLVVSPDGGTELDPLGLAFAVASMASLAAYFVIAGRPSHDLPPIALAAGGLLVGAASLAVLGGVGLLPFTASARDVPLLGDLVAWWVPLVVVGIVGTAFAYAASVTGTALLGSRLASFVGLLEVVIATFYAWLLLGEQLTIPQFLGGALILAGIAFVRSEKADAEALPEVERAGTASADASVVSAPPARPRT